MQVVTEAQLVRQLSARSEPGHIVLIMPEATLPAEGRAPLEHFLKQGNHLLTLSGSAFASLPEPPILETLTPPYKTWPTSAARLRLQDTEVTLAAGESVITPLPRPRGLGSGLVTPARFIPMVEAFDQDGRSRGATAHLYLNTTTDYAGSVWGGVGLTPAGLDYTARQSVPLVLAMLDRIRRGVFLADAGPEHVAYVAGEPVVCGADLVNLGGEPVTVQVSLTVTGEGRTVHDWSGSAVIPARTVAPPRHVGPPPLALSPGEYLVKTRVQVSGLPVDAIDCPMRVVEFGKLPPRDVVGVSDGEFSLAGRPWHPLGMNYWPHLSVGLEPKEFSRNWLSPGQYDPDLVERDLGLAEQLGLNVLSIQYSDLGQARPLMDFLARAARHRLKVHIYCPALEPLRPDLAMARRMILGAHLPESPAFFAYDVCWE
ncbi:MAG: hypothetical protein HYV75_10215, partial [Opitutae bacterium]|nr:hypothetical protein [Opitutae bacterium]